MAEQSARIKQGDCSELTAMSDTVFEDNGDLKPLEMCNNELNLSDLSLEKELNCMNTKNTFSRGNVQTDHNSEKSKLCSDKKSSDISESQESLDVKNSLEVAARDNGKVSNIETENFEMSSDEDLFGDPFVFESLCRSSDALCHATQGYNDSQQSSDLGEKQSHHSSQSVVSVKQENGTGDDKINFPLPAVETKTQHQAKKETMPVQSTASQKRQSLLSFVTKSNMKATATTSSLKQTDIGVFFGLKPLTKPVDSKLTTAKNSTKASSSLQLASVSGRLGGWRGRSKDNQGDAKNMGYSSEGQSSGAGEDISAVSTGTQSRKSCPFYKKIPNSAITVDAFRYGDIPGCHAYFLSHFHYDHYAGLNGKFKNPIYCSKVSESA